MGAVEVGSVVVALIAAFGAWAAQRAAAKASTINTAVSGRLEAERGAYERARDFDIQTIERQQAEIAELRAKEIELRATNERLNEEIRKIAGRVLLLERELSELEQGANNGNRYPDH